jgi:hypothetical protein
MLAPKNNYGLVKRKTAHMVSRFGNKGLARLQYTYTALAFSTKRVATQFLVFDIGRLSVISIMSPALN